MHKIENNSEVVGRGGNRKITQIQWESSDLHGVVSSQDGWAYGKAK